VAVSLVPFATGLTLPVFATGRRDGSGGLLVIEQAGKIRILNSDGTVEATPFLDITDRVLSGGEQGLLGLALHPDYENNGRFYVDYTRQPDGATVISEFQANDRFADPGSARVLLTIPQPYPNHNGGMLAFDSEGMLLIGMGDGGNAGDPHGNGQNTQALLGKLLRIDVNSGNPYAIPKDNPFATSAGFAPEIWDYGLRNPWRFSFDRLTGDLFIGDVGQDTWEEVDAEPRLVGGRNYGWNRMEGAHCYGRLACTPDGLTLPVMDYLHGPDCSITGGYVYRGAAYPALEGAYLFGDYCSGALRVLSAAVALADGHAPAAVVGGAGFPISSFGQDDAGELYVVDLNGSVSKVTATSR
jgi:glucose/arabinose dehydrogenase